MAASVNRKYIPEVDQLRAFAAFLVLFYHAFELFGAKLSWGQDFDPAKHWVRADNPLIALIQEGHSGVGLFIVLSGFILSTGSIGLKIEYRRFLIARILRIYPLLIVCLMVGASSTSGVNILQFVTTLLPLNMPGSSILSAFTAMFWAVSVEFQLYLLFPFLMTAANNRGIRYLFQAVALCIALRILAVLAEGANPRDISYWTVLGRADQFLIGMIAARLYVRYRLSESSPIWILPSTIVVFFMLWKFNHLGGFPAVRFWKIFWPTIEGATWAVFIVAYIPAARANLPAILSSAGTKIGEISFSIYMVHYAILYAIMRHGFYIRLTGLGYYDALITAAFVAAPTVIVFSKLSYIIVELPFLIMRRRYVLASDAE